MLGHSNIAITLDAYSHVLPNMQESAAAAMEEVLLIACWHRKRPGGLDLPSSFALRKDSGPGTISMAVAVFVR